VAVLTRPVAARRLAARLRGGTAVVWLALRAAAAQEPPSPPPAALAERLPTLEREASFELGLLLLDGATELRGGTGALTLLRRSDALEAIVALEGDHLETDTRVLRRFGFASATADLWHRARWSPFALANWTTNHVTHVDDRYQLGAGVKHLYADSPGGRHSVSLALLWEREESTLRALGRRQGAFLSWRLKDAWHLSPVWEARSIAFWQVDPDRLDRYRLSAEAALEGRMGKRFALVLSLRDDYDAQPFDPATERNQVTARVRFELELRSETPLAPAGVAGAAPPAPPVGPP
jgi:hypothetical protein